MENVRDRWAKWLGACWFLALACLVPSRAIAMGNVDYFCDSRRVAQAILADDLDKALRLSLDCEETARRSRDPAAELVLKGYMFATAELLTEAGSFMQAGDHISLAARLPSSFLVSLDEIEDTANGYLLERGGRQADALALYRKIDKPHAWTRMAAIFLARNEVELARSWAQKSLQQSPDDAATLAILGAITEKTDSVRALAYYQRALELAENTNSINALTYLEVRRARSGVARLRSK